MFQLVVYDNGKYKQLMREEIERITHRDYTGSVYPRATSSPQSNHWEFIMQPITDYTYTTHKEVNFESHKAYSISLLTTKTSSQNHTDFTGFYSSYTESYMNNYKNMNMIRKHLETQYTRTLMISSLNHNKAQRQSC